MNTEDQPDFMRRLMALAEVFDAKLSPARSALYFEALRDVPMASVVQAMNAAVKGCKFFPRPVELREFAQGNSDDAAESAWLAFQTGMRRLGAMASVSVRDAALAETITAMFGSWAEACAAELSPEMWAAKRKEFGRIYRVMRGRMLDGGRYLIGTAERHNGQRGDWMRYTPVGRIDMDGSVRSLSPAEADAERQQLAAASNEFSRLDARSVMARLASGQLQDGAA